MKSAFVHATHTHRWLLILAVGLVLIACGGDGDGEASDDAETDVGNDMTGGIQQYMDLDRGASPGDLPCGMEVYNFMFGSDPLANVRYGYNESGRLEIIDSVTESGTGITFRVVRVFNDQDQIVESVHIPVADGEVDLRHFFTWDQQGRIVEETIVDEQSGQTREKTTWEYASDTEWTVLRDRNNDGMTDETISFVYDPGLFVISSTIEPGGYTEELALREPLDNPADLFVYEVFERIAPQAGEGDTNGDGEPDYTTSFTWMGSRLQETTYSGDVSQTTRYLFSCP